MTISEYNSILEAKRLCKEHGNTDDKFRDVCPVRRKIPDAAGCFPYCNLVCSDLESQQQQILDVSKRIRDADIWDLEDCRKLCMLAGDDLLEQFEASNSESFEEVVFAAAKRLGVEIL